MTDHIQARDKTIKKWIHDIGQVIIKEKDSYLEVEQKTAANDLVTNMDKWVEKELVERIRTAYSKDRILGEEGFGDSVKNMEGTVWLLDPIDGTLNFVLQNENFALMLAIYEEGIPVQSYIYNVTTNELYAAIKDGGVTCNGQPVEIPANRCLNEGLLATNSSIMTKDKYDGIRKIARKSLGLRLVGSAGLETIEVAKGSIVAYIATNLKPWDIAPGILFMKELGLKATQFDNEPVDLMKNNNIIFAVPKAHKEIMDLIHE
ncbi:inositol monophosphatase family protein [Alkalibacterium kapii]|uniref:Inositol monophosphatase n=1 Tax=Alkalibacterium kapii TaxID=426704 RepID=A0A511ATI0_9LACT|nr:inositol monophosphatase [Alkalibacterium kapii]GEK91509.1 inositol monophosphatase [Alkalibacterium kapii]